MKEFNNNGTTLNQRVNEVDILKGLCIIQMVAFHTRVPYLGSSYLISITIPCFFYISGYFFKCRVLTLFKSFDKLIVPYLTTFILFGIFKYFNDGDFLCIPRSIWFLYVMFFVILLYFCICKVFKNKWLKDIACMLLLLLGYAMNSKYEWDSLRLEYLTSWHYNFEPFKIGSVFTMVFVFHIGYRIKHLDNSISLFKRMKSFFEIKSVRIIGFCLLFALVIVLIVLYNGKLFYSAAFNQFWIPLYMVLFLWFINILFFVKIAQLINKNTVLQFFGRYSLIVLCFHVFILYYSLQPIAFLIIMAASPFVILFMKNTIPFLYGLKPSIGETIYKKIESRYPAINLY